MCEPPCHWVNIQPMEDRIEYGIEEKSKRAYHYHDFKSHDKKNDNTSPCDDIFTPFSEF